MRIVHLNVDAFPERDVRMRKVLQWHRRRGIEDVWVCCGFFEPPVDCIGWKTGTIDGYPLIRLSGHRDWQARRAVLEFKPDVIHVHELDALWALLTVWPAPGKRRLGRDELVAIEKPKGVRIIYEAHEYERDRLPVGSPTELIADRVWREERCLPHVDELITVSPAIRDQTRRDIGRDSRVVPNAPYSRVWREGGRERLRQMVGAREGDRIVAFAGNVTHQRALHVVAEAKIQLGPRWRLVLLGDFTHADQELRHVLARAGAFMVGSLPYPHPDAAESFIELLSGADVAVNLMDLRVANCRLALPNKFFEYAWARVPAVHNRQVDVARLSQTYALGLTVESMGIDPRDGDRVAGAIDVLGSSSMPSRWADFMADWCFEATGGRVLDDLYT